MRVRKLTFTVFDQQLSHIFCLSLIMLIYFRWVRNHFLIKFMNTCGSSYHRHLYRNINLFFIYLFYNNGFTYFLHHFCWLFSSIFVFTFGLLYHHASMSTFLSGTRFCFIAKLHSILYRNLMSLYFFLNFYVWYYQNQELISTFVQKLAAWISKNAIEISRADEDGVSGDRISHFLFSRSCWKILTW